MSEDPNRYAEGLDADALRERVEDQQIALDVLAGKYQRAERARQKTFTRFEEIEKQYMQHKALLRDADAYVAQSKQEHDAQLASLAATRAFFHPVRKTPVDVLGLIFEHCFGDLSVNHPLSDDEEDILSRQRQPFHLAAVCRRWRQASLAHPRAWNRLELSFDDLTGLNIYRWHAFVEIVLTRARSAPLGLCVTRLAASQRLHSKVVWRLVHAMPRCLHAEFTVANISPDDALLPILTAKTPKLVHAYLDLAFAQEGDADPAVLHPFPYTPVLRSIHTDNAFYTLPSSFTPDYPLLESARFSGLACRDREDHLRCLLRAMPNLRDLRLDWPSISYEATGAAPLAVPGIKSLELSIDAWDTTPLHEILYRVDFSGLTRLVLSGNSPSTCDRLQFLRGLSSRPRLENLLFSDIGGQLFNLLLDELHSLPNIATLSFERSVFTGANLDAFQAFLCPPTSSAIWPCRKLDTVMFHGSCSFAEDCDAAVFVAIINGRAATDGAESDLESPVALRSLSVETWETAIRGPIQDRIDHAIQTAVANLTV